MEPVSTSQIGAAMAASLVLWWFSTGAILWLVRRPPAASAWTLGLSSIVAVMAMIGLAVAAPDDFGVDRLRRYRRRNTHHQRGERG